jgi:hypothetical protein
MCRRFFMHVHMETTDGFRTKSAFAGSWQQCRTKQLFQLPNYHCGTSFGLQLLFSFIILNNVLCTILV